MPSTRVSILTAGAALLAAFGWSIVGPLDAPSRSPLRGAPSLSIERSALVDGLARPVAPGSATTTRRDALPPASVSTPMQGEPTRASTNSLRTALLSHDLATAKELLADAEDPRYAIDDLVNLVLGASDLVTQLMAVQLLAAIHREAASAALIRIAHEDSIAPRARTQAMIGLGNRAGDVKLDLGELLAADEREVRLAAFRVLGLRGEPDALRPLETALRYEDDAGVRRVGFEALAQLGTPGAVQGLLSFLEREDAAAVGDREGIFSAIGTSSTPEAVPELLDALAWAEDPALRAALIRGLGSSADVRAFDVLLETVAEVEGGESRLDAINGLGLIGDPRALDVLQNLEVDGDERERRFSHTAIQRIIRAGS